MSSDKVARCSAALTECGITAAVTTHAAVMNVAEHQEALTAAGVTAGVAVKCLLLKSKKKQIFCVIARHDRGTDMKFLAKVLGGGGFRFHSDLTVIGVEAGSVTPLAVMNDADGAVTWAFDASLAAEGAEPMLVHPLENTGTVSLTWEEMKKFHAKHGKNEIVMVDFDAAPPAAAAGGGGGGAKKKKAAGAQQPKKYKSKKGETGVGIKADKLTDFPTWYSQVVTRSEMIDYYDISGCYILRPWSFSIWENIQTFLDGHIRASGVKNSYFPLFVSASRLQAEKDHIEGFAAEVAWVTKSGSSDLVEPVAVRPTSETIMYPAFAKWIRSHRDLPLRLNQWSNVVRWEFKNPTPFIRSREFLWQEGHSAFATADEAAVEVLHILDLYSRVYEELLAVPVVKGKKTEVEKFAGGDYTTTVEAFIPVTGRGIQGATSHGLGQSFAKMFNIQFESAAGKEKQLVWQNSWGLTTRTIGVMVMVHGDNKGLRLPPRVSPIQVIIVPIWFKEKEPFHAKMNEIVDTLTAASVYGTPVRCEADARETYNPGYKFNDWEMKGVPVRLELGPKELEKDEVVLVRRDTGAKQTVPVANLSTVIPALLREIQDNMLSQARQELSERITHASSWSEFTGALAKKNLSLIPFCNGVECEEDIKKRTGEECELEATEKAEDADEVPDEGGEALTGAAKSLCIPFEQGPLAAGATCVGCGKAAVNHTLFGRSY